MNALSHPQPVQIRHWENLRRFRSSQPRHPIVELDEFLSFWEVSNSELAEICSCSVKTVERWFFEPTSPNKREPTDIHKQRLAEAHYLWWFELERERAFVLKEIYRRRNRTKSEPSQ